VPAVVRKRGDEWVVLSHEGEGAQVLGRFKDEARAKTQARAVNASLHAKGKIR
jgi:hypothetical protein